MLRRARKTGSRIIMVSRRRKKDTAAGSYSIIVSPKDEDGRRPLKRYNGLGGPNGESDD